MSGYRMVSSADCNMYKSDAIRIRFATLSTVCYACTCYFLRLSIYGRLSTAPHFSPLTSNLDRARSDSTDPPA